MLTTCVVKEIILIGSRCGNVQSAMDFISREKHLGLDLSKYLAAEVDVHSGDMMEGFHHSQQKGCLKVQYVYNK